MLSALPIFTFLEIILSAFNVEPIPTPPDTTSAPSDVLVEAVSLSISTLLVALTCPVKLEVPFALISLVNVTGPSTVSYTHLTLPTIYSE